MYDLATVRRAVAVARQMSIAGNVPQHQVPLTASIDALTANYPIVAAILGCESFHDLAVVFIAEVPPESTALAAYGRCFPEWIDRRKISHILPYLSAVADIDRLRLEAMRASAETPVSRAVIAAMTAEQWSSSRVKLHAAARFGWFAVPAPSIWLGHFVSRVADVVTEWKAEGVLITRPERTVQARRIGSAEHRILAGLRIGETIGAASAAAHALYPEADITGAFDNIVAAGAIAALRSRR